VDSNNAGESTKLECVMDRRSEYPKFTTHRSSRTRSRFGVVPAGFPIYL
jgi:hypothetical protein